MLLIGRPIAIVAVPRCVLPLSDRVMRMRRGSPFSRKMALPVYRDENDNVVKCLHSGARLQKLDSTTLGTILKGANLTKPRRFQPFWLSHKYFNKYVNIQNI